MRDYFFNKNCCLSDTRSYWLPGVQYRTGKKRTVQPTTHGSVLHVTAFFWIYGNLWIFFLIFQHNRTPTEQCCLLSDFLAISGDLFKPSWRLLCCWRLAGVLETHMKAGSQYCPQRAAGAAVSSSVVPKHSQAVSLTIASHSSTTFLTEELATLLEADHTKACTCKVCKPGLFRNLFYWIWHLCHYGK